MTSKPQLKTCPKGHQFYKSSETPTCPECEKAKKSADNFLSALSAPARRSLQHAGITSLKQLSTHSEKSILKLHGMGLASLPALRKALQKEGLKFSTNI